MFAEDAQAVDEITRKWVRGQRGIAEVFAQIEHVIEDIRTGIADVHEEVWDDVGLVTCWIEQDYTLEGKAQHVSSPTTVVLRRENAAWRIALIHAIPLPEA
jgi:ketosteroid isomerase-like protein